MNRGAEPVQVGRRLSGLGQSKPDENWRGSKDGLSNHRHGGVGGRGMFVQGLETRDESCPDGRESPTAGASGPNPRGFSRSVTAVGAAHSSEETVNHRGAKGPHLVEVNSETEDWRWLCLGKR